MIEGTIEQWLEQEKQTLSSGDSAVIPASAVHATSNDGEAATRIYFTAPDLVELRDLTGTASPRLSRKVSDASARIADSRTTRSSSRAETKSGSAAMWSPIKPSEAIAATRTSGSRAREAAISASTARRSRSCPSASAVFTLICGSFAVASASISGGTALGSPSLASRSIAR